MLTHYGAGCIATPSPLKGERAGVRGETVGQLSPVKECAGAPLCKHGTRNEQTAPLYPCLPPSTPKCSSHADHDAWNPSEKRRRTGEKTRSPRSTDFAL